MNAQKLAPPRLLGGDDGAGPAAGVGMFTPIFAMGLMYVFFPKRTRSRLLAYAFATTALSGTYAFETATIRLVGGVLVQFIVLAAVLPVVEPCMWRRLSGEPPVDAGSSRYGVPPRGGDAPTMFGPAPSAAGPPGPRPLGPNLGSALR